MSKLCCKPVYPVLYSMCKLLQQEKEPKKYEWGQSVNPFFPHQWTQAPPIHLLMRLRNGRLKLEDNRSVPLVKSYRSPSVTVRGSTGFVCISCVDMHDSLWYRTTSTTVTGQILSLLSLVSQDRLPGGNFRFSFSIEMSHRQQNGDFFFVSS